MLEPLMALYLTGMALLIVGLVLYQHVRRTHELVSLRNLYLAGYIVYLLVSAIIVFLTGETDPFMVRNIGSAGMVYCFYLTVYTVVFFWAYSWHRPALNLARKVPVPTQVSSDSLVMLMALVLALLAIPLRFSVVIPLIGALTVAASFGFIATSASLVGWAVSRNVMNPVYWVFGIAIVSIDLITSIINQFGRRPMLAVLLAVLWGAYYARIRFLSAAKGLAVLACLIIPPFLLLSVYTAVRTQEFREMGALQIIQELMNPADMDIVEGIYDTLAGQTTGAAALWTIENYPEPYARRHLFSLGYLFVANIPRALWPEKPVVFSGHIAYQANIQGANVNRALYVDEGVTLPPGVIAYAEAEGGLYAVIIYAIFFAVSLRFLQNLGSLHPHNAFVFGIIGASLGNLTGLARGDISLFYNMMILSMGCSYLALYVFTKVLFPHTSQTPAYQYGHA